MLFTLLTGYFRTCLTVILVVCLYFSTDTSWIYFVIGTLSNCKLLCRLLHRSVLYYFVMSSLQLLPVILPSKVKISDVSAAETCLDYNLPAAEILDLETCQALSYVH